MSLLMSIVIRQETIKKILILLFSIFFVLFCFEFILSFFIPKYAEYKFDYKAIKVKHSEDTFKDLDIRFKDKKTYDEIIFNNKKDIQSKYYDENRFILSCSKSYTVYQNTRFRQTKCNRNSKQAYVFLGCSFVFGHGVDDEETLPYYFSEKLNFQYNVINYGVPGASSNMAINILNTGLNKDITYCHFFFSMMYDHVIRNFMVSRVCNDRTGPSDEYLLEGNKIKILNQPYYNIINIFKRSYMFRKIFVPIIYEHNEQYYEYYMVKSLEKMNNIIEEKYNSKLTIVVWEKELLGDRFVNNLKKTNLDLIFLPDCFNSEEQGYRIKYDKHPTAKANKEIAEILYNHINNLK
jgi:hypothetical protein